MKRKKQYSCPDDKHRFSTAAKANAGYYFKICLNCGVVKKKLPDGRVVIELKGAENGRGK